MASALWLGETLGQEKFLRALLALPVRELVLPWEDVRAERLLTPDFPGEPAPVLTAGERRFWHLPLLGKQALRALAAFDVYLLAVEDFSPLGVILEGEHGRLLALGEQEPPAPIEYKNTPRTELLDALSRALPFPHPAAFYLSGDVVSASVVDEDYGRILERMGGG